MLGSALRGLLERKKSTMVRIAGHVSIDTSVVSLGNTLAIVCDTGFFNRFEAFLANARVEDIEKSSLAHVASGVGVVGK